MTEQMPPEYHDDRELDEFLARRGKLSQRYREAAGEGAPPRLDAAILQQASEELRRTRPLRRWQRWSRPLAVAASLTLVVSLAWTVRSQQQDRIAAMASRAGVAAPPLAKVSDNLPAPAAAPAASGAPVPAAPEAKPELKPERRPEPGPETDSAAKLAPPTTAYEMWKQARAQQQSPPPAARHPAFAGRMDNAAPTQDALGQQGQVVQAPVPPPPPAPIVAAPAAPAPQAYAGHVAADQGPQATAGDADAAAAATQRPSIVEAAPVSDPCASTQRGAAQLQAAPEHGTDTAAWLEHIRQLRDAQDQDAARAELACFVAARPQAPVPDDLKALLDLPAN